MGVDIVFGHSRQLVEDKIVLCLLAFPRVFEIVVYYVESCVMINRCNALYVHDKFTLDMRR
jgi:hypothetical protein